MANFCHSCATPVAPGMKACPECGTWLLAPAGASSSTPGRAPAPVPEQQARDLQLGARHAPVVDDTLLRGSPPTAPIEAASIYPAAPAGRRFLAMLIDALYPLLFILPGLLLLLLGEGTGSSGLVLAGGALLAAAVAYSVYYQFTKDGRDGGASIGKRHMGLMVVHLPSDTPCTRGQSAQRALVMALLNLIPAIGWLIEPVMVLAAADGRRLGDRAADTQVIDASLWMPETTLP